MTDYREEDGPALLNLLIWIVLILAVVLLVFTQAC